MKTKLMLTGLGLTIVAMVAAVGYGAYAYANQAAGITNNVTFKTNNVAASVYYKAAINDTSSTVINPASPSSDSSKAFDFTATEASTTKTKNFDVNISDFTDASTDYYLITFFIYNLGEKDIYIKMPTEAKTQSAVDVENSVEGATISGLSVKLTKSTTDVIIKPNVEGAYTNYYSFSLEWKINALTADVTDSLAAFNIQLSGYPLAA